MSNLAVINETVDCIFREFEKAGLCYAILRNYDDYPNFSHDIDLVLRYSDIQAAREILSGISKKFNWDLLAECSHWNSSSEATHTIEIFKMYSLDRLEYLQIDLFHGMALWGLPFLTEHELLSDRTKDPRGFWKISEIHENLMRFMQLNRIPGGTLKHDKYLKALEKYVENHSETFFYTVNLKLGKHGCLAFKALLSKNQHQARLQFNQLRLEFLLEAFQKMGIVSAFKAVRQRCLSQWNSFIGNPCGLILTLDCPETEINRLSSALETLQNKNWLIRWRKSSFTSPFLSWGDLQVLERGGILLKKTHFMQKPNFAWNEKDSDSTLLKQLALVLIKRHPVVYTSEAPQLS